MLKIVYDKPRKNTVKLLLLIDSDGSMLPYSRLCNRLFQAVSQANHFKDLKIYYFHNCIYDHLYTTPYCKRGDWIETNWVLRNLDSEYKVIFVGDAAMAPSELYKKRRQLVHRSVERGAGNGMAQQVQEKIQETDMAQSYQTRERGTWMYGAKTINAISEAFSRCSS